MKYTIFYLALLVGIAIHTSCKKDPILPSATQSGANTFGCKVNGEIWIPDGRGGINGVKAIDNVFLDNALPGQSPDISLWFTTYKSDGSTLHLYLRDPSRIGEYLLNRTTGIIPNLIFPADYGFFSKGRYYVSNEM